MGIMKCHGVMGHKGHGLQGHGVTLQPVGWVPIGGRSRPEPWVGEVKVKSRQA